jgi:hypothetical protein
VNAPGSDFCLVSLPTKAGELWTLRLAAREAPAPALAPTVPEERGARAQELLVLRVAYRSGVVVPSPTPQAGTSDGNRDP